MPDILVLSKGANSPSTRYRAIQYFERFAAAGYRAEHRDLADGPGNYLAALNAARKADIVLVLRKTLPPPLLWALRKVSRRLIFDLDDAIFCNTDGSPSATRMSRFRAMASACDRVMAGNAFLAEVSGRYNSRVSIMPTAVDVARYQPGKCKPDDSFDVVWIGSSSTRKYLEEVLPALRLAATRIPRLRLKIIADFDLDAPGFPTLAVPWSAQTEAAELASAHVGIAPMRADDWSRGKCALKVLQYMAAGLPVVSSPVGVNREAVVDGESGFLVDDDAAWVEALLALANDTELTARMGRVGRARVERLYAQDVVAGALLAAFAETLSETGG